MSKTAGELKEELKTLGERMGYDSRKLLDLIERWFNKRKVMTREDLELLVELVRRD